MKNECSIIRDLLPLEVEKMVRPETADFVNEHILNCAECRAEREKMINNSTAENQPAEMNAQSKNALSGIKRKLLLKKIMTAVLSVFAAFLIVGAFGYYAFFVGVPVEYSSNVFEIEDTITLKLRGSNGKADLIREFCANLTSSEENAFITRNNFIDVKDENGNILSYIWEVRIRKPLIDIGQTKKQLGFTIDTINQFAVNDKLKIIFANKTFEFDMETEGLYEPVTYEEKSKWKERRLERGEMYYEDYSPDLSEEEIWDRYFAPFAN